MSDTFSDLAQPFSFPRVFDFQIGPYSHGNTDREPESADEPPGDPVPWLLPKTLVSRAYRADLRGTYVDHPSNPTYDEAPYLVLRINEEPIFFVWVVQVIPMDGRACALLRWDYRDRRVVAPRFIPADDQGMTIENFSSALKALQQYRRDPRRRGRPEGATTTAFSAMPLADFLAKYIWLRDKRQKAGLSPLGQIDFLASFEEDVTRSTLQRFLRKHSLTWPPV